jgi:benzoyl-CoA reductase/2-hydroxyglutaryl-CoA dehydratase subunit BcrC/BadD/HgdB
MTALEKLSDHLRNRLSDLQKAKGQGRKIVGYLPGGYLPEELVLAAGAIPVCMIRGGDHSPVEFAGAYICRWVDTFCRAQIGYAISKSDPYYGALDLLAIPITDNHVRAVSDTIAYNTKIDVFPFGVPHMKEPSSLEYYLHGITKFKARMESLTGNEITKPRLKEAILLCNREGELLREISLTRKSKRPPISGRDFAILNHSSYLADKEFMVGILESVVADLKGKDGPPASGPRILLTGSTLAMGDYRAIDFIQDAGASIVIEEFAEGIRPYWDSVSTDGNLMNALADCYFGKRIPPGWFRPGKERRDNLIKLARDFAVDGVVWYQLMYRESYKSESYYFPDTLTKETGLRMMVVESDYDQADAGQLRTRVETFIETVRR